MEKQYNGSLADRGKGAGGRKERDVSHRLEEKKESEVQLTK